MVIRIGLLGASKIAGRAVIEPALLIDEVEVVRIAARDPVRACAFAAEHRIPATAPDYAGLVRADDVDLVYNALPPSAHAPWSIAALAAGKHVLCEKPFATNADEAAQMVSSAQQSGRLIIEAFHYRYHPLFARVLEILADDEIGVIEGIEAHVNIAIPFATGELRYAPALGGGALMDLGCYPVHWTRSVMGTEPEVTSARAVWHESGVDLSMHMDLSFPGGVRADIRCSMAESLPPGLDAVLKVTGKSGTLRVENPLVPHTGHLLTVHCESGHREERVDGATTFFHQLEYVVAMIRDGTSAINGDDDAIANMRVIDAAMQLAVAGR